MTSFSIKEFDSYTYELINYLVTLQYSKGRLKTYKKCLITLKQFLERNNLREFNSESLEAFINYLMAKTEYKYLARLKKDEIRVANVLMEYTMTGTISFRTKTKQYQLTGEIGEVIMEYLNVGRNKNLSESTIDGYRLYLSRFHKYLIDLNFSKINQVNKDTLRKFINTLVLYSPSTRHCTLSTVRGFMRFLKTSDYLEMDLSPFIPKDNYKQNAKLPTTYTQSEIEKLIQAIDRGNPKGKRDYAIILLAARLGLRASDICQLKFTNIQWEQNTISLFQKKTGISIELPLSAELGNAIIDYLKYSRPVSESPYLLLHVNPRYERLQEPTIHSIVSQYLLEAKIKNIKSKKHGPHALRHSLVSFLLEKKTPLPVISEVLGHTNTESTKSYLSIDINSLRQCALEIPPLNTNFYGGERL
jgi:site-specific recombinase XerD